MTEVVILKWDSLCIVYLHSHSCLFTLQKYKLFLTHQTVDKSISCKCNSIECSNQKKRQDLAVCRVFNYAVQALGIKDLGILTSLRFLTRK